MEHMHRPGLLSERRQHDLVSNRAASILLPHTDSTLTSYTMEASTQRWKVGPWMRP